MAGEDRLWPLIHQHVPAHPIFDRSEHLDQKQIGPESKKLVSSRNLKMQVYLVLELETEV